MECVPCRTDGLARDHAPLTPPSAAARLPPSPEFLFSEEALVHQRTWSENLTFVTGVCYLGGAAAGGALGAAAGLRVPLPAGSEGWKMRANRVLNHGGKQGRLLGNSGGVAGLLFSSLDSGLAAARGGRRDGAGTVAAAAATGALFKGPQGVRAASVWAAAGALAGGAYVAGSALADALS
jgi:import inner membrane translocase subunit TIM23